MIRKTVRRVLLFVQQSQQCSPCHVHQGSINWQRQCQLFNLVPQQWQQHPWSLLNWVEIVSINWHPWQVHQSGLRSAFCGQRCWKLSLSENFQNPAGANWPNFFPTSSKPLCIMDNWLKSWAKTGEIDRKQTFYRFCRNQTAAEGFPQPFCRFLWF